MKYSTGSVITVLGLLTNLTLVNSVEAASFSLNGYLESYIPYPTLPNPLAPTSSIKSFDGDDSLRTFPDKSRSRFWQQFTTTVTGTATPVVTFAKDTGITEGLDATGTVISSGKASTTGLTERLVGTPSSSSITVEFVADVGNPLITSPSINSTFKLELNKTGTNTWAYNLSGEHDGFPAYNYFLNGTRIFNFGPSSPSDVTNLFPIIGDTPFSTTGTITVGQHNVPEPITILGTCFTLAALPLMKRERKISLSNRNESNSQRF